MMRIQKSDIMKKIIICLTVIVFVLMVCPIPIKISKSMEGIQLSVANINDYEVVNIQVEGVFYWRVIKLFGKDSFKGNLSFSSYPYTQKKILEQERKFETPYDKLIPLEYYEKADIFDTKFLGHMGMKWKFQHFAILVQSDRADPKFLIAYATNLKQAFQELQFVEQAYDGIIEYKQVQEQISAVKETKD